MIYIKDMQRGQVREYGTNGHDSLHLSLDGRTLTYENLQNGDGSSCGDYRICDNPNGILPEDMDSPESVYTYVDIGGNSLNSTSNASYSRGYADGTADEYHAIMDILNKCGVTVCMEDGMLLSIAEYVKKRYDELGIRKPQQKTGEWIEDYQEDELPFNKRGWICSNCNSRTSYGTPPFCMRCGAKMEVKHE